ncbi:hypothetical protein C8Q77DRAFT_1153950 [Trametes polyzona]|nr:hypothetical protein C8Q77DRAFT_1153950 [Trametes polyzona]
MSVGREKQDARSATSFEMKPMRHIDVPKATQSSVDAFRTESNTLLAAEWRADHPDI